MSNMEMSNDVYEAAMELASGDKLFFKGQLLPSKKDPTKLPVVQALPCPKEEAPCDKLVPFTQQCANLLSFQFPHERCPLAKVEDPCKKRASNTGLLIMCDNDDSFTKHCVPQAASSTMKNHAHGEGFVPELRDGFDLLQLCQLDSVFDLLKSDSRSSSFRSHRNSHWSSGERDSRNSSSRHSNGSCQDSWPQESDKKASHVSMLMAKYANTHVSTKNERDMPTTDKKSDPQKCGIRSGELPISTANSRKWSWKGLFTGLRKASTFWADGEKGEAKQAPSKVGVRKKTVFTFKDLPCAPTEPTSYYQQSIGHDWEWQQTKTHWLVSNEGSSKTGRPSVRRDAQIGTVFCLRSDERQETSFNGDARKNGNRDKGKEQGNVWNAKEGWNRCVSRVKESSTSKGQQKKVFSMRLNSKGNALLMGDLMDKRDHWYRGMKVKSLTSTPFVESPVRMLESHTTFNPTHGGANIAPSSSSSMKSVNKKMGFASCPASKKSSPHHSGRIAGMSKVTPDFHTAIQGAIAHCKQSQGS